MNTNDNFFLCIRRLFIKPRNYQELTRHSEAPPRFGTETNQFTPETPFLAPWRRSCGARLPPSRRGLPGLCKITCCLLCVFSLLIVKSEQFRSYYCFFLYLFFLSVTLYIYYSVSLRDLPNMYKVKCCFVVFLVNCEQ